MARITKAEREQAIANIRDEMKDGATIFYCVRKVSASGMSRDISIHVIHADKDSGRQWARTLGYNVARVLGYRYVETARGGHGCVRIGGCGFDATDAIHRHLEQVFSVKMHREVI
jgi:hypothetical protein